MGSPKGKFARKPIFAEKSTASTIMWCPRTPRDRIPATSRVEFDRKVKLGKFRPAGGRKPI